MNEQAGGDIALGSHTVTQDGFFIVEWWWSVSGLYYYMTLTAKRPRSVRLEPDYFVCPVYPSGAVKTRAVVPIKYSTKGSVKTHRKRCHLARPAQA